jgi:hypothetical protein
MRRLRLAVAVTLLVPAGWLSLSPAHAQGGAVCSFTASFSVLPGYSTTPSRGSFTTGGETGTVACVGVMFGQEVLGPGTFGFVGQYGAAPAQGDTCEGGQGQGLFSFHIPTSLGLVHAEIPFTESFVGNAGQFFGAGPVADVSCLYQMRPTEGDCLTSPARRESLTGQGVIFAA